MRYVQRYAAALAATALIAIATSSVVWAQQMPDARMAEQRAAMAKFAWMDGTWRGPATSQLPSGAHSVTQTERIGPMLDGTVRVLEGKGYNADGSVGFNAFATISFNPQANGYVMHSYAQGQVGDFKIMPSDQGYVWEIPAGPMIIRYTATYDGTVWREVGERIMPGQPPQRFFEMTLNRVGKTDWPAAGALPPK